MAQDEQTKEESEYKDDQIAESKTSSAIYDSSAKLVQSDSPALKAPTMIRTGKANNDSDIDFDDSDIKKQITSRPRMNLSPNNSLN